MKPFDLTPTLRLGTDINSFTVEKLAKQGKDKSNNSKGNRVFVTRNHAHPVLGEHSTNGTGSQSKPTK